MKLEQIWRYPFKGFGGELIDSISLSANALLPGDRQFAITTGHPKSHAQLDKGWLAKRHFIQQAKCPQLARYHLYYHPETKVITLFQQEQEILRAAETEYGKICDWLFQEMPDAFIEKPKLVSLSDGGYTDTSAPWISLCTTASLQAFADATGTSPDIRRFRLNMLIDADTPFDEFSWAGKFLKIGDVVLEIIEPVGRCNAINTNQDTGEVENDFFAQMPILFDHTDLGVFARIITGGQIKAGDKTALCNSL